MKKLITLSLLLLLIILKANAQDNLMSLNGIGQTNALAMIKTYGDYIDSSKKGFFIKQQSVLFHGSTFKQMIGLVNQAKQSNPNIDGVRIYFGIDGDPNGSFVFQIIIVPTVYYGIDIGVPRSPSGKLHKDFYLDAANPLFQLKNIQGKIQLKGVIRKGDLLYKTSDPSDDITCKDSTGPHYITRQNAETWVKNFGSAKMMTKSEWFDLDLITALANDPVHDGIRIYFAKHGPDDVDPVQDVANKDIFIFVTTQKHGFLFISHKDYFNCSITQAILKQISERKRAFFKLNNMLLTVDDSGTNPGGQDKGELCPNSCNPSN